jgi:hypothetical protein
MVIGAFIAAAIVTLLKFPDDPAAWSVVAVVVIGFRRRLDGGRGQSHAGLNRWLPTVAP